MDHLAEEHGLTLKRSRNAPERATVGLRRRSGLHLPMWVLLLLVLLFPTIGMFGLLQANLERADQSTAAIEDLDERVTASTRLRLLALWLTTEGVVEATRAAVSELGLDFETLSLVVGEIDDAMMLEPRQFLLQELENIELDNRDGVLSPIDAQTRFGLSQLMSELDDVLLRVDEGRIDPAMTERWFDRRAAAVTEVADDLLDLDVDLPITQASDEWRDVRAVEALSAMLIANIDEVYGVAIQLMTGGTIELGQRHSDAGFRLAASMATHDAERARFERTASPQVIELWNELNRSPQIQAYTEQRSGLRDLFVLGAQTNGDIPQADIDPLLFGELGFRQIVERVQLLEHLNERISSTATIAIAEEEATQRQAIERAIGLGIATLVVALVVTRLLLRPLGRVRRRAERLSNGIVTSKPLGAIGPREVATVSLAMDQAADTLRLLGDQMQAVADQRLDAPVLEADLPGVLGQSVQSSVRLLSDVNQRLQNLAVTDELTQLPNRMAMMSELDDRLGDASPSALVATMFADLDGFKAANDTYGHPAGDAVLIAVAARFKAAVGDDGIVGRIGGDEFLVVMPNATADSARGVAQRMLATLDDSIDVAGIRIPIGASVGIALGYGDTADPEALDGMTSIELLQHADMALYSAKGTDLRIVVCDFELKSRHAYRRRIEADLAAALSTGSLRTDIQPIVDVHTGSVTGGELLARWERNGEMVPPLDFVSVAEETNLIVELGRWAIDQGASAAAELAEQGRSVPLSINVSWRHISRGDLLVDVARALRAYEIPGSALHIEFTESLQPSDTERAIEVLSELRRLGVGLSLDDFGTGYSSITHLRLFGFDTLKLDRSMVTEMLESPDGSVAEAVIEMARKLDLRVIAEGVETAEQARRLAIAGCEHAQGWLWSRAVSHDRFGEMVRHGIDGLPPARFTTRTSN